MRLAEAGLVSKRSTKFSQSCLSLTVPTAAGAECPENCLGGIIKRGQLGWLAQGPLLEVHSLRSGQKISSFHFDINLGFENCIITSVAEVEGSALNCCLLAIGILFGDSPGSVVALYSVKDSKVVRCIEIKEKVTCCAFVEPDICKRTVLHMLQGCLAVGTENGKIFLLDINLAKCEEALLSTKQREEDIELVPCHTVSSTLEFTHIREHHKHSKEENVNFGIELKRTENAGLILSMLSLTPLLALAVGLEDGRMILYDLSELLPFYVTHPPENLSPLVKIAFMEPPDDPRACIYLWSYHEHAQTAFAVMHSLMYDKKMTEDDGVCLYEGFQSLKLRLTLPMYEKGSLPITCRTISKFSNNDDDEILSLCLFAWKKKKLLHIILFDINQWYKEEMPPVGDWRDNLNYLAHFQLQDQNPLDVYIDPSTVASFNSIQRSEEHFYPISLCFDCVVLDTSSSSQFHWPGLQNRALELLSSGGPTAILDPSYYFNEVMRASLMPQFSDHGYNSSFSANIKREILLSIALEYNCFGLLKECAKCWADGSCLGRRPYEGLSLSTLTEWIWKRAGKIKNRSNILCAPLFDHSGVHMDQRSQKELSCLCRQLKLLAELYNVVLTKCKEYIPETELETLSNQYISIRTAAEYQEVLQWLLNIGLLPEGYSESEAGKTYSRTPLVPYPYKVLKSYYMNQRARFGKMNKGFISSRTQSCRILYIDSFIEHECNVNVLRDHWVEMGGNGLYPPPSLQAMLRVLLVPDVPIENKYVLFIYLFLDLNMAIEDESCSPIVQSLIKFPAVFKMNASLIKTVQAFWNLDHSQFEVALEEIISPFSQDRKLSQWQQDLLIEALLAQDQSNLALQALQARVSPISSLLELKTLLANDLVAEAYHLQRSKNDPELLRTFLNGCFYLGKWGILRDLALTEDERKMVEEFLRETKSANAENLHFVYLLQRSKYVEAISYLDELSKNKQNQRTADLETPNLILSAYNLTMTPAVKKVSNIYCNIRGRIKPLKTGASQPMPFSCELLKNGIRDVTGGVYHSSALSTDQASIYWDDGIQKEPNRLLDANNVPFVRQPQLDVGDLTVRESLSYPEIYKAASKRPLNESSDLNTEIENPINPPKRQKVGEGADFGRYKNSFETLNASLLTRFKAKNKKDYSVKENSLSATCSRHDSKEKSLLSTPFVKSRRVDLKEDLETIDNTYERVCTPHSILKVKSMLRTSSPSPAAFKSREQRKSVSKEPESAANTTAQKRNEVVDEEKFIRFNLPRRSDITVSSLSLESSPVMKSCDASPLSNGPQRRKPIRSNESSAVSVSDVDEFFSPIQSQDTSKVNEEMDVDSDTAEVSREVQEEDEDSEMEDGIIRKNGKSCENETALWDRPAEKKEPNNSASMDNNKTIKVYIETFLSKKRLNVVEGPKARRPLRRSGSPVEDESHKKISDRQIRGRSRSKTPDIPSSPSRRSSRLAEKSDRGIGCRKPLSRMVLEANIQKTTVETLKETENSEWQSATALKLNNEKSQSFETKYSEKIIEISSTEFTPKITSSFLKSHPWQNKVDDLSTRTEDDKMNVGEVSLKEVNKNIIVGPAAVPVDDSILGESFAQNRSYHLMTTMEISSFSGGDVTLEEYEPPGNLLSDSDSGDSKTEKNDNHNNNVKKEADKPEGSNQEAKEEKPGVESTSRAIEVQKKDNDGKNDDKNSECDKNNTKHEDNNYKKVGYYEHDGWPYEKDLDEYFDDEEFIKVDPEAQNLTAEELEELRLGTVRSPREWEDRSTPSWGKQKQSDEESEEGLSIDYSIKSSGSEEEGNEVEKGDDDEEVVVINISSTTDEDSSDSVQVSSPDKRLNSNKNEEESVQNFDSSKDEDNNISDLLYGDIDKDESVNENVENDENDDSNDGIIFEKTSSKKSQLQESENSEKPSSSPDKNNINTSSTKISEEQKIRIIEKEGKHGKKKENIEKLGSKPLQISSVRSIGEGMTLNFLTGEEEIIEDETNLKKSNFAEATLSEVAPKKPLQATECDPESSMEVDEDPLDLTYSRTVLNEPLNTESREANVLQDEIIEKHKAKDAKPIESPKSIMPPVPILIVSPPEDSNDATIAHDSDIRKEREIDKKSEQIERVDEVDEEETETAIKSIIPAKDISVENDTQNTDKGLEQVVENKIPTNYSDRGEFIFRRDQPSTSSIQDFETDLDEAGTSLSSPKRDQPSTSTSIDRVDAETENIEKSSVPDVNPEKNNIKLLVSDENQGGSENKNGESRSNRKISDRNNSVVELITSSSNRVLRNKRTRSESIEIERDLISPNLETPKKFQRGKSVPRTEIVVRKSRIRRLSESSSCLTPSRILTRRQSQFLERIEEDNSLDSPAKHTRSRQRLNSNESDQAPITPTMNDNKRTRRSSVSSAGTPIPTTPRTLRGSSVLSEENVPSTPKRSLKRLSQSSNDLRSEQPKQGNKLSKLENKVLEPEEETTDEEMTSVFSEKEEKTRPKPTKISKGNKRANSRQDQENVEQEPGETKMKTSKTYEKTPRKQVVTPMDEDSSSSDEIVSQKSTEAVKRGRKPRSGSKPSSSKTLKKKENEEKVSEAAAPSLTEELSASRRLTRNQRSMMEKNFSPPILNIEPKRLPKRRSSNAEPDSQLRKVDNESEVESVASSKSRKSSIDPKKKTTRRSLKEQQDDDASSEASSTISRKSTQSKKTSEKSSKMKSLKSIPEEDIKGSVSSDDEAEQSPKRIPKKRGRPKK